MGAVMSLHDRAGSAFAAAVARGAAALCAAVVAVASCPVGAAQDYGSAGDGCGKGTSGAIVQTHHGAHSAYNGTDHQTGSGINA